MCTLSLNYIGYFYYVFPLHLNSFSRLFSDVINGKLFKLKSLTNELSCLLSEIMSIISFLKYINLSNKSITSLFTWLSFIKTRLSYIDYDILNLNNIKSNTFLLKKYIRYTKSFFNSILYLISLQLNNKLNNILDDNKDKLDNRIKQIDDNIKLIITEIKRDLEKLKQYLCDDVIKRVSEITTNLQNNYSHLDQFNKYNQKKDLFKKETRISMQDETTVSNIFSNLKSYERRLKTNYNSQFNKLTEMKNKLNAMKAHIETICSNNESFNTDNSSPDLIDRTLFIMNFFRHHFIPKLMEYKIYFINLKNNHTTINYVIRQQMKNEKILDETFSSLVKSLKEITINEREIHTFVSTMNTKFDYIITELQLIKSLLQYRDVIHIKLLELRSLYYNKYNIFEFVNNLKKIIQTLKDTEKTLQSIKKEIDNVTKVNGFLSKYVNVLEPKILNYITFINLRDSSFYLIQIICQIKCRLKTVESSSNEFECAIEGVARNLIGCTLLSLRKHVITDSNSRNCNVDRNKNLLENRVVSMY